VGDAIANTGPLYVGKDMSQPGVRAFVAAVQLHSFALEAGTYITSLEPSCHRLITALPLFCH